MKYLYLKKYLYMLLGTSLFLSGLNNCTTKQSENNMEKELEDENITALDDIILSYEEMGINLSSQALLNTEDIFNIENEDLATDYFKITPYTVEEQFLKYATQEKIIKHQYNKIYDENTNDILWDQLEEIIYKNSLNYSFYNYKTMSKTDIKYLINLLKDYLLNLKKYYPKLDIQEIACKLENLSLFYAPEKDNTYAATTHSYIVYFNGEQSIKEFDDTSIHEFFHLICFGCECVRNNYYADGICLNVPTYSFNKDVFYGINYKFIEEVASEKLMSIYLDNSKCTYQDYEQILENIEMVLSLNDFYELDSYIENCVYKNPIDFIRAFPVGEKNTQENFTDNVRMLVIYDALLRYHYPNDEKLVACFNECQSEEEINKSLAHLINYSQSQLTKLFFTNLIVLSDKYGSDYFEYYSYLIKIFDKRMKEANYILMNIWDLPENYLEVIDFYNAYFNEMRDYYIEYLVKTNEFDFEQIDSILNQDINPFKHLYFYPKSVSKEKKYFYNSLENKETIYLRNLKI